MKEGRDERALNRTSSIMAWGFRGVQICPVEMSQGRMKDDG